MKKINIANYKETLTKYLKKEKFTQNQIDCMLGDFVEYQNDYSEFCPEHSNIQEYSAFIKEFRNRAQYNSVAQTETYMKEKFPKAFKDFAGLLKSNNISIHEALSLYEYTDHCSEILNLQFARKNSQNDPHLIHSLKQFDYLPIEKRKALYDLANSITIYTQPEELMKKTKEVCSKIGVISFTVFPVMSGILTRKQEAVQNTLAIKIILKTHIAHNTVLHRGVEGKFLTDMLKPDQTIKDLVGAKINEEGFMSTSLLYKSSFAGAYGEEAYPIYMQIYMPKGSEGMNITPFSKFSNEYEFLCNENDLFIFDVDTDFVDENKNHKTLLKCFLLSKDREVYKNIGNDEASKSSEEENA